VATIIDTSKYQAHTNTVSFLPRILRADAIATKPHQLRTFRLHTLLVIIGFHIVALVLALFTFTWSGLVVFAVMVYITFALGLSMGNHRLFSHYSFKTPKAVMYTLAIFSCMALEGGPIRWVATHRLHHKESDHSLADPHTPVDGFWWAHIGWTVFRHPKLKMDGLARYAPDLCRDPVFWFLEQYYYLPYVASLLVIFGLGWIYGGLPLGLSWFAWGGLLRTIYVWHLSWMVNSVTHSVGYRNYAFPDNSRNTWWLALMSWGEGWHNNHHAHPRSAKVGHRWFELDPTYWTIQLLSRIGLASSIIRPAVNVSFLPNQANVNRMPENVSISAH
jgi:fatty-acid desaturase